jgi:hypothetical protein
MPTSKQEVVRVMLTEVDGEDAVLLDRAASQPPGDQPPGDQPPGGTGAGRSRE